MFLTVPSIYHDLVTDDIANTRGADHETNIRKAKETNRYLYEI